MTKPFPITDHDTDDRFDTIAGCLLGGAVGDALGLPYERIKSARVNRLYGKIDGQFHHHLILNRGMLSDDTEHALFTAMAIDMCRANDNTEKFPRYLAGFLKRWIISFPAGVGKATLIACGRLLIGVSPDHSGISSAGNGPAMRAPIIGVLAKDENQLIKFVRQSTRITHRNPKAELGALAIAAAGRFASRQENINGDEYLNYLQQLFIEAECEDTEKLFDLLHSVISSIGNQTTEEFAKHIGLQFGVSGYIYHTVPIVLHAWLNHPNDYQEAVLSVIRCGGDTDTTAAITGGIVGACVGKSGIPEQWIRGLFDFPFNENFIEKLARNLAQKENTNLYPISLFPLILLRNISFFLVIMAHVFRRLLPPY